MRVHVVDPSAYTPPYDHALCRALGLAGAEVELFTSRFAYGPVAAPEAYARHELFYRLARFSPNSRAQRAAKLAEHVPDMLRYRRAARDADVVHFQWLPVQHLDGHLLPARRTPSGARRGLVLTAHDVLPREPRPGQLAAQRRLYDRFDAIIVHSEHGRARLTHELGLDGDRIHVIPHGVLTHLADVPPSHAAGGRAPFQTEKPVVLCFGLMRPYKGIDVLLEAWRGIEDAELWIAGMPRMDISSLLAAAPANVRFVPRFVTDSELPAYFRRADLVVLPYREIDQSGVLFTALAFGKPLLLSDVGGFPEVASTGAARVVPAGDPGALHEALRELLGDPATLTAMAERAREAAEGRYSWTRSPGGHWISTARWAPDLLSRRRATVRSPGMADHPVPVALLSGSFRGRTPRRKEVVYVRFSRCISHRSTDRPNGHRPAGAIAERPGGRSQDGPGDHRGL